MKTLIKTAIAIGLLSLLVACSTKASEESAATESTNPSTQTKSAEPLSQKSESEAPLSKTTESKTPQGVEKIQVTEQDKTIALSAPNAPAGQIDFVIRDRSQSPRELWVIQTNLEPEKLPVKAGKLDETAPDVKVISQLTETQLKSGKPETLMVNLPAGKYVIAYSEPGKFATAKKAAFVVHPK